MRIRRPRSRAAERAFTLPEAMMASSIFLLLLGAVVWVNLFGLRMVELINPKLSLDTELRPLSIGLMEEIAAAKNVRIGTGSATTFIPAGWGTAQQGNAIQLYYGTNTTQFTRYYLDTSSQQLCRMTNGATAANVIAGSVTNSGVFRVENHQGTVVTYFGPGLRVAIDLQFLALPGSDTPVGASLLYKGYRYTNSITIRTR